MNDFVEVDKKRGRWQVTGYFNDVSSIVVFDRQRRKSDAHKVARGVCLGHSMTQHKPIELQIKDRNHVIRQKDTFGHDPRESKG